MGSEETWLDTGSSLVSLVFLTSQPSTPCPQNFKKGGNCSFLACGLIQALDKQEQISLQLQTLPRSDGQLVLPTSQPPVLCLSSPPSHQGFSGPRQTPLHKRHLTVSLIYLTRQYQAQPEDYHRASTPSHFLFASGGTRGKSWGRCEWYMVLMSRVSGMKWLLMAKWRQAEASATYYLWNSGKTS